MNRLEPTNVFSEIGKRSHESCVVHGFSDTIQDDSKMLLLIHAEISEAAEWLRKGNPKSDHIPEFSGIEEELADAVIRICNYAYAKGFKLSEAISSKMEFNDTREYKHGGKLF